MQIPQHARGGDERFLIPDIVRQRVVRHRAGDERHNLSATVVHAERFRNPLQPRVAQVTHQALDAGCPRAGGAVHAVAAFAHFSDIAARQLFFFVYKVHWLRSIHVEASVPPGADISKRCYARSGLHSTLHSCMWHLSHAGSSPNGRHHRASDTLTSVPGGRIRPGSSKPLYGAFIETSAGEGGGPTRYVFGWPSLWVTRLVKKRSVNHNSMLQRGIRE